MDLDRKLKTALDESRLLILGAQVLFGFLFQAVFQDLFKEVPPDSQVLQCAGLGFMLLSVCLLIAPSLYHQIIFEGESRSGALAYASWFAGASLLPLTLGLGASVFVVFEHLFGRTAGAIFGITFTAGSLLLLYGLGLALRRPAGRKHMPDHAGTPQPRFQIKIPTVLMPVTFFLTLPIRAAGLGLRSRPFPNPQRGRC
jgi:hypothetical protein